MSDPRRSLNHAAQGLTALALLALAAGCEAEPRNVNPSSRPSAPAPVTAQAPSAPAPAPAPAKADFIVGRTTTEIKPTTGEMPKNAQQANMKITAKDPITLQGNAYVTAIGRTAMGNIKHAMDLFYANEGRYPKDFAEFDAQIMRANNMTLPKLPYYQEYRYNENTHALEIWEYPDKKAAPMPGG